MKKFGYTLLLLISLTAVSFNQPALAADDFIKLTFLGTGAPRPSAARYGPSILVEAGPHKILVDAGSGMRERLFYAGGYEYLTQVDHVLVTHLHFDHTISIPGLWLSGWLYGRRTPFLVQGPAGTKEMMTHLKKAYAWDIEYRDLVGVPLKGVELEVDDVTPGIVFNKDGVKIRAFEVEHMPINLKTGKLLGLRGQTLGYRIDYGSRSVLFSGDTRTTKNSQILKYGKGVDVLIHEVQVPSPGDSKEAKLANVSLSVHTTPEQVGYVFSQTRPKLGVYSHIIPPDVAAAQLEKMTRPYYSGAMKVAEDLMIMTIGEEITFGVAEDRSHEAFEKSKVLNTAK